MSKHTQSAPGKVLSFPQRRPYPYGKAPRFDPGNPAHVEAWQACWELGQRELLRQKLA
jgi:hypothetical protein